MIGFSPGIGPQKLEGPDMLSGSIGAYALEVFQTPLLDLTKTYLNIELIPARPGYFAQGLLGLTAWSIEKKSGVQVTPPTIRAGNDSTHTNLFSSTATTPSNTNVNGANPPSTATGPSGSLAAQIPNTTVYFDLTSPAVGTGGYVCMARFTCAVFWVAVG